MGADLEMRKCRIERELAALGQAHVFRWWPELSREGRERLLTQLEVLDLEGFRHRLQLLRTGGRGKKFIGKMTTPDYIRLPRTPEEKQRFAEARACGERLLSEGRVGVVMVAGGQGTRLGYHHPKGMFPIGPVTERSLFQIHAEKIIARGRRHGTSIPWCIMTSEATHAETVAFFEKNRAFGLAEKDLRFFRQEMIPAVDHEHRLILEAKDRIFCNPNGHGGTLKAMWEEGVVEWLERRGVTGVYYFQVDNAGLNLVDPVFLGFHHLAGAEMSCKALIKKAPEERLGIFGLVDGVLHVIEYSDFDPIMAAERDANGELVYCLGSPAVHTLSLGFIRRLNESGFALPYHIAEKTMPCIDERGQFVERKNGLKFETFIFDALPLAKKWVILEMDRQEEWAPLKNRDGDESPATVRAFLTETAARWLEAAGCRVPRIEGRPAVHIEISPLYALDAEELAQKLKGVRLNIKSDLVIGPEGPRQMCVGGG